MSPDVFNEEDGAEIQEASGTSYTGEKSLCLVFLYPPRAAIIIVGQKKGRTGEKCTGQEWRFVKGLMRREFPHRQEDAYELEHTALAAKRKQQRPLEAISSIGA